MPFSLGDCDKWLANNKLRFPSFAKPDSVDADGTQNYRIELQPIKHQFHPKLCDIPMWSFGPTSPGLFIEACVGTSTRVAWYSKLTGQSLCSLLDIGTRMGMEEDHMLKVCHNAVHLHGARVSATSDGSPEVVFHPNEGRIFYYPNTQAASLLWYHDHAMDVTRMNVYAGLFGGYILRDPAEAVCLPSKELELPLILQDKSFNDEGTKLRYVQKVEYQDPQHPDPGKADPTPEFVGDYPVVNGQIWPLLELEPRIYRLRLLNGANTRFFNLSLVPDNAPNSPIPLYVIGMEGGFLEKPVSTNSLLLAPGERADVLVDLRQSNGVSLILSNNAAIPYQGMDNLPAEDHCAQILKITVGGNSHPDDARFDPATLKLPPRVDPLPPEPNTPSPPNRGDFPAFEAAVSAVPIDVLQADLAASNVPFKLRRFSLVERQVSMPTLPNVLVPNVFINGESYDQAPAVQPADPKIASSTVNTSKNALEVWEFINQTGDAHPMHLHLVQFQVMSRRKLGDMGGYGAEVGLAPYEMGWKDTVVCPPGQATRIVAKFDGGVGGYVYHCHILEHEDMGMMGRLIVEPGTPQPHHH